MNYLEQYDSPEYRPLFWPELIALAVNIMILIALASWIFSGVKKVLRGEEVALPTGLPLPPLEK